MAAMTLSDIDALTAGFVEIFAAMTRDGPGDPEKNGDSART